MAPASPVYTKGGPPGMGRGQLQLQADVDVVERKGGAARGKAGFQSAS